MRAGAAISGSAKIIARAMDNRMRFFMKYSLLSEKNLFCTGSLVCIKFIKFIKFCQHKLKFL